MENNIKRKLSLAISFSVISVIFLQAPKALISTNIFRVMKQLFFMLCFKSDFFLYRMKGKKTIFSNHSNSVCIRALNHCAATHGADT